MKILRIDRRRLSRRRLAEAVAALRAGAVVAYPTDTAYGLAADPNNPRALEKICAIKGREKGKPLPFIAGSVQQARKFAVLTGKSAVLAEKYWPGPLTIVCAPRRSAVSPRRRLPTVAVRVPRSLWARAIASAFGGPITSTSANPSGLPAPYSAAAVRRYFAGRAFRPDVILDAGKLPPRPVSTIIRLRHGKIEVLRQGATTL